MAILFYEDWFIKHPTAIIDLKTPNKSFLRLAGVYKKMGIKNHAFLLALHNEELQGVDPHDENLTDRQKLLIAYEIIVNPWYYFREVFKVPPVAGSKPNMFRANRANIGAIWIALNHITSYLIQPRQTGKSLTGDGLDAYMLNIKTLSTNMSIITKDDKLRIKTSSQIRNIIEYLPPYLQMLDKKDIKNSERLTVKALNNTLNIFVGRTDKKAADNLGRGATSPIVRIDEFAYIYNIFITLPVLLASTVAAREEAKKANMPYYIMFSTTPGKLNTKEGMYAYDIYKNSVRWTEKFFDSKNEEDLIKTIKKNNRKYDVVLLEFNHRQLGYTDEWLAERMKVALADGEAAESDFLMKWVAGNMKSPIPKDILNIIVNSKVNEPETWISKHGYVLYWYINNKNINYYKHNKFLIIGLDTSDALGEKNDYIGLVIRDSSTGAVVAGGKFNETNLASFADFLVELLEEFPNSMLVPERRSSATAIMDFMFRIMIAKNMNPFKRIFNLIVHNIESYSDIADKLLNKVPDIKTINKYKKQFGYATSGQGETTRTLLYGTIFKSSIKFTADKVYYHDLITQLAELRIVNNRIDHGEDGHDDLVIAWLLAMYIILMGKNTHLYGLKPEHKLKITIDNEISNNVNGNNKEVQEQIKIKKQIEHIVQQLKHTNNEIIANKLITKLRTIEKKINPKILINISIDDILENIKIARRILKK